MKPEEIKVRSRLEPGKMFLVDLEEGRIIPDDEIKNRVAPETLSRVVESAREVSE